MPLCALTVDAPDDTGPPCCHALKPASKPPLATTDAVADGATAFDGADTGPVPTGFDATTVKV